MANFKVDIDEINGLITYYKDKNSELIKIRDDMKNAVEKMKEEAWDSDAGEAVLNRLDSNWCKNLNLYIEFVENLGKCLVKARDEFEVLIEEAKKIGYSD